MTSSRDSSVDRGLVPLHGGFAGGELRTFLSDRLPDYMVPAHFVEITALPRTTAGKIDRARLPAVPDTQSTERKGYVGPRDWIEFRVRSLWEEILGVSPIGVRDGFFELGGNSLRAAYLLTRVEQEFGQAFPLTLLFDAGTVEEMSIVIGNHQPAEPKTPLVRLQPSGSRSPLFVMHTGGGTVIDFVELARTLDADRPVFGLARVAEGPMSIEDIATHHAQTVRATSAGPYYLAGWSCSGGVIAMETARRLVAEGGEVPLVFLLDTPRPAGWPVTVVDDASFWVWLLGDLIPLSADELRPFDAETQLDVVARKLTSEWRRPPRDLHANERARQSLLMSKQSTEALWRFQVRPYDGRVVLFRASHVAAEDGRWAAYVPRLEVVRLQANHNELLLRPAVIDLARRIRVLLTDHDQ